MVGGCGCVSLAFPMVLIRAEIWCAAFVRRHNDVGKICVVVRKGDPIAGQIWIEIDHLDGTSSLFSQASSLLQNSKQSKLVFQKKSDRVPYSEVKAKLEQEINFDPDFWILALEDPKGEHGLEVIEV